MTLAVTILLGFASMTQANAHAEVVKTSPAADATVNAPLDQISITLNEPPLLEGSAITISNQDGSPVDTEAVALDGAKLYIPWPADIAIGDITVDYRVASNDGHVVDGTFSFTFTGAATSEVSSPQPSSSPSMLESKTASPEPSEVVSAVAIATPLVAVPTAVAYSVQSSKDSQSKLWIYIGLAALIIVAFGLFVLRRKK